jgi:holo-[acyl-carrier protein] synthase
MKALGTGWRGLAFRDIEIGRDARGKPTVRFHGRARDRARQLGVFAAEVSITHTASIAAAAVVLLGNELGEERPQ